MRELPERAGRRLQGGLQKPGRFRIAGLEKLKWIVPANEYPRTRPGRGLPQPYGRATGRALMRTVVEPQNWQAMVTACDSFESSIPPVNLPKPLPAEGSASSGISLA